MTDSALLTAKDVAERLGIALGTVQRMAARGELPGKKIAGRWRFDADEVERELDRQVGEIDREEHGHCPLFRYLEEMILEFRTMRMMLQKIEEFCHDTQEEHG